MIKLNLSFDLTKGIDGKHAVFLKYLAVYLVMLLILVIGSKLFANIISRRSFVQTAKMTSSR